MADATATTTDGGISQYWWLALGIIIVALAFDGSRTYGGWFLLLIIISMLAYAKEKGRI